MQDHVFPEDERVGIGDNEWEMPVNWAEYVANYSWTGYESVEEQNAAKAKPSTYHKVIGEVGRAWIDKHLCPLRYRGSNDRKNQGKMCKWNLTQDSIEQVGIVFNARYSQVEEDGQTVWRHHSTRKDVVESKYQYAELTEILSSESICIRRDWTRRNSHIWTTTPIDYVTITYERDGHTTGSLKIVVMNEGYQFTTSGQCTGSAMVPVMNYIMNMAAKELRSTLIDITTTNWQDYPFTWDRAIAKKASSAGEPGVSSETNWKESGNIDAVYKLYQNIEKAMPLLLSYRYYSEIFSLYSNGRKFSLVDYDNDENVVIAKPLPVMNASNLYEIFSSSFAQGGNFNTGKTFLYTHCVIDLDPETQIGKDGQVKYAKYPTLPVAPEGQFKFPMKFMSGVSVNNNNEYKTSKLVLTRIEDISGENFNSGV